MTVDEEPSVFGEDESIDTGLHCLDCMAPEPQKTQRCAFCGGANWSEPEEEP